MIDLMEFDSGLPKSVTHDRIPTSTLSVREEGLCSAHFARLMMSDRRLSTFPFIILESGQCFLNFLRDENYYTRVLTESQGNRIPPEKRV